MRYPDQPTIGETMQCSVCGKQFKSNDDTKYITNGGYTCSWQCFLDHVKRKEKLKKEEKK